MASSCGRPFTVMRAMTPPMTATSALPLTSTSARPGDDQKLAAPHAERGNAQGTVAPALRIAVGMADAAEMEDVRRHCLSFSKLCELV